MPTGTPLLNCNNLPDYKLALWHGFNLPLLMSVLALVLGTAIYFGLQRRVDLHSLDKAPATPVGGACVMPLLR